MALYLNSATEQTKNCPIWLAYCGIWLSFLHKTKGVYLQTQPMVQLNSNLTLAHMSLAEI